LATTEATA